MAGSAIRSEGGPPDWLGKAAPRKPAGALQLPEAPGEFSIAACSGVDDGLIEPHPSQRAALPSFAHFKVASHAPLILTGDPRLPSQVRRARWPAGEAAEAAPLAPASAWQQLARTSEWRNASRPPLRLSHRARQHT